MVGVIEFVIGTFFFLLGLAIVLLGLFGKESADDDEEDPNTERSEPREEQRDLAGRLVTRSHPCPIRTGYDGLCGVGVHNRLIMALPALSPGYTFCLACG